MANKRGLDGFLSRPGDAFETGVFLPARQIMSFPEILADYRNSEALQRLLPEVSPSHYHADEDRHLLDAEAGRLDDERMVAEIARYHAARRESSMLAMINTALPLGRSANLSGGQEYLLRVARDERDRLGQPVMADLSRAGAAMRKLICEKLDALNSNSVTVAADGDTLIDGTGAPAAVLGQMCPTCWYATRAALAQRAIDDEPNPVLGQGLLDPSSVAILYVLVLVTF
ncbi:hypothetical protein QN239_00020 [Mycolicibacterium sp. Y3]